MYRDVLCFTCYLLYKHTKHSIVISPPNTKLIDKESSPGKRKKKKNQPLPSMLTGVILLDHQAQIFLICMLLDN